MQITFDTTTITDDEVRGIFALLDTVRPEALASSELDLSALAEPIKDFNEWIGEKVTKLTEETAKSVSGPSDPVVPDTDSTGLPWDERIHASSKALNADGTWRTKRGVDKALVASVEAELRQRDTFEVSEGQEAVLDEEGRATGETVAVAPPAPPAPVETHPLGHAPEAPKAPLAPTPTPAPNVDTNPTAVPVAESSVSAPAVATGSVTSPFVALMKRVTTAQGAGKLTQPRVKELLESLDKKSIMDLRTDEDALASFAVLLDGEGV